MKEMEEALDDCLQQLAAGQATLDECLSQYPEYSGDFKDLLEAAALVQSGRELQPSAAMKARGRARLAMDLRAHPRSTIRLHALMPRLTVSIFATVLTVILVIAVAGTALAQSALPGQPLYAWKLSTERLWRAASGDPVQVDLQLADRRTDELLVVVHGKDSARDGSAYREGLSAYNEVLTRLQSESTVQNDSQILSNLRAHHEKLSNAGIDVPELDEIVSHGKSDQHKPSP